MTLLRRSVPSIALGLALTAGAMWSSSLTTFVIGGVIAGAGAGMVFKGSLGAVVATTPAGSRAEALAGFFLGAYVGLSIPVIGLGVATQYVSARVAMLIFAALAALAIAGSVRAVIHRASGLERAPGQPVTAEAPAHRTSTAWR